MSESTKDAEALHFAMSHPEAVAREMRKLKRERDEAREWLAKKDEAIRRLQAKVEGQARELTMLEGCGKQRDAAVAQRDALAKAADKLVWLKRLKRKIEAGTATDEDARTYRTRKAFAWVAIEKALAALEEA